MFVILIGLVPGLDRVYPINIAHFLLRDSIVAAFSANEQPSFVYIPKESSTMIDDPNSRNTGL